MTPFLYLDEIAMSKQNKTPIRGFKEEYRWLSNFWPATIQSQGLVFPTVEHAYVFAKFMVMPTNEDDINWFLSCTPAQCKRAGRQIDLRADWDDVKFNLMLEFTRQKYSDANPELKAKLRDTGEREIVEENTWYDIYWGETPAGVGENNLGKIIMQVRDENNGDQ